MDGNFEHNIPGWYEVQFSQVDDFRNKDKSEADLAKFGHAYAVKFVGDAGTYYWSKREKPEDGQKYWGYVEPSKSGKSMNFKWKAQDAPTSGVPAQASSNFETVDKQASINRSVALNNAVLLVAGRPELEQGDVLTKADEFLGWLESREDKEDEPEEDYNRRTGNENPGLANARAVNEAIRTKQETPEEGADNAFPSDDPRYQ